MKRLNINNDTKQAVGNVFVSISTACFVYVFLSAETNMSLYLPWEKRWVYLVGAFVCLLVGCVCINSKKQTSTERYGIRMVQMTHPVHVKVDGRSPLPPIVEEPKETKTKSEKKKKDKRKRN